MIRVTASLILPNSQATDFERMIFRLNADRAFTEEIWLARADWSSIEGNLERPVGRHDFERIPLADSATCFLSRRVVVGRGHGLSTTVFFDGGHLDVLALHFQANRPELVFASDVDQKARVSLELGLILQIGGAREAVIKSQGEVLIRLLGIEVPARLSGALDAIGGPFPSRRFSTKGFEVGEPQLDEALFKLKWGFGFRGLRLGI